MGKRKNILVITYWDFSEAHIQANVLPNLKILSRFTDPEASIFLFCFNKKHLGKEDVLRIENELSVFRIRLIFFDYSHFGVKMLIRYVWLIPYLCYKVFSAHITSIYAWCTTAGAIGYLVSIITRRPLILESYEPHAEAMVENGYWTTKHFAYRVLSFFEKKQAQRASFIIAANSGMRQYVQKRYNYTIPADIFFSKPACVELDTFYPDEAKRNLVRAKLGYRDDDIVCLYAGKFGGIYLKEETFVFFRSLYDFWKERIKILLLTAHTAEEVEELATKAGLPFSLFTVLYVSHKEVPEYMRAGDFAICPVKPVPTKRYCTPVKNGEYWASGLPVVITKEISDDSSIIEQNMAGAVLYNLSSEEYQKAINKIDKVLHQDRKSVTDNIRLLALQHRNYKIAEDIYRQISLKRS